jgi:hypothetical protein
VQLVTKPQKQSKTGNKMILHLYDYASEKNGGREGTLAKNCYICPLYQDLTGYETEILSIFRGLGLGTLAAGGLPATDEEPLHAGGTTGSPEERHCLSAGQRPEL